MNETWGLPMTADGAYLILTRETQGLFYELGIHVTYLSGMTAPVGVLLSDANAYPHALELSALTRAMKAHRDAKAADVFAKVGR